MERHADNDNLGDLDEGDLVEITSGQLKGQVFKFHKWTNDDKASAKGSDKSKMVLTLGVGIHQLVRPEDSEPLQRSVKRSIIKKADRGSS
eukprot:scaffold2212_cov36-Prasinocladus_malaysianus.AAC.1